MARVPRMRHEGWPSWAKTFFILFSLALVVGGIIQILSTTHDQFVLGIVAIVIGLAFLYFWLMNPRWRIDPALDD